MEADPASELPPLPFSKKSFWRRARADRLSILIDAKEYYENLAESVEQAQHSICIAGWDFDSRIKLRRADPQYKDEELGALISRVVNKNTKLHVYILIWNFFFLFSKKRNLPPWFQADWVDHPRIHFVYDTQRPIESAMHAKLVVIDRSLAYVGCTDLSRERWDVKGHIQYAELRINPDSAPYRPHHDLQAILDGEAAEVLAQYFEREWKRSTGNAIQPSRGDRSVSWPKNLDADFTDSDLVFSRTAPPDKDHEPVREIESILSEIIRLSKRFIYIEMQYISAKNVVLELRRRLEDPEGPFVLIVLPRKANSLVERKIMSVLQRRKLKLLIKSDRYARLKLCFPATPTSKSGDIMLHSKLMIVDGRYLHLGSANYTDRSMGLDTELDFTLVVRSPEDEKRIVQVLINLIAEHMGCSTKEVATLINSPKDLYAYIDRLSSKGKSLKPFEITDPAVGDEFIDGEYSDPDQLYAEKELGSLHLNKKAVSKKIWGLTFAIIVLCAGLVALWQFTPFDEWFRAYLASERRDLGALSVVLILLGMTIGSVFMMPITLITLTCVFLFGPWWGIASSTVVSLFSSSISYGLGRWLNRRWLGRLMGSKLKVVYDKIKGAKGLTMMILIRLLPIAPFGVVNLAGGASRIAFFPFIVGTFFGLLPGKLVLAIFADRAFHVIRDPSVESISALVIVSILVVSLVYVSSRWLERRSIL